MNQDLHDFCTAITADIRELARLLERLGANLGYIDTERDAHRIADDVLDAYNQLEGQ